MPTCSSLLSGAALSDSSDSSGYESDSMNKDTVVPIRDSRAADFSDDDSDKMVRIYANVHVCRYDYHIVASF